MKFLILCIWLGFLVCGCGSDEEDEGSVDSNGSSTSNQTTGATGDSGCFTLSDGKCVEETFRNPPVLEPDANGVYNLALDATEVMIDGQRHCVRAYNGTYPGPTIETPARSGDEQRQVRVNLINKFTNHDYQDLSGDQTCACKTSTGQECFPAHVHDRCLRPDEEEACLCTNSAGEVCKHMFDFNVTNLHAHGSHVRPDFSRGEGCRAEPGPMGMIKCRECGSDACDGDSSDDNCYFADDVLSTVHPGEGAQHRWDIDEDGTHHAGFQWYHPHIHGTTTIQVASGAAGAWIVRGEIDALPGIKDARERIIQFSTPAVGGEGGFTPLNEGESCTQETLTFNNFGILVDLDVPLVGVLNGQRKPRMVTAPGQVERWRILSAAYVEEAFMGVFKGTDSDCSSWSTEEVDTVKLTQIARDGLTMPQVFEPDYLFMSPGYRIDAILGGTHADGTNKLKDGETYCFVATGTRGERAEDDPISEGAGGGIVGLTTAPTEADIKFWLSPPEAGGESDLLAILNVTDSAGPATETSLPDYSAVTATGQSEHPMELASRCDAATAVGNSAEALETIDQVAVLQVGYITGLELNPCKCDAYNVNCRNFETTDRNLYPTDRELKLGEVEHWRIGSSTDGHPFHIHINPFLVCPLPDDPEDPETAGRIFEPPFAHWRDTYLVNLDRKADLITEYKSYTGSFVFHCHKLNHEDDGMMELITITDSSDLHSWNTCEEGDACCLGQLAATMCTMSSTPGACTAALGQDSADGPAVCPESRCCLDRDCAASPGAICTDNYECKLESGQQCTEDDACASGNCRATPPPSPRRECQ